MHPVISEAPSWPMKRVPLENIYQRLEGRFKELFGGTQGSPGKSHKEGQERRTLKQLEGTPAQLCCLSLASLLAFILDLPQAPFQSIKPPYLGACLQQGSKLTTESL